MFSKEYYLTLLKMAKTPLGLLGPEREHLAQMHELYAPRLLEPPPLPDLEQTGDWEADHQHLRQYVKALRDLAHVARSRRSAANTSQRLEIAERLAALGYPDGKRVPLYPIPPMPDDTTPLDEVRRRLAAAERRPGAGQVAAACRRLLAEPEPQPPNPLEALRAELLTAVGSDTVPPEAPDVEPGPAATEAWKAYKRALRAFAKYCRHTATPAPWLPAAEAEAALRVRYRGCRSKLEAYETGAIRPSRHWQQQQTLRSKIESEHRRLADRLYFDEQGLPDIMVDPQRYDRPYISAWWHTTREIIDLCELWQQLDDCPERISVVHEHTQAQRRAWQAVYEAQQPPSAPAPAEAPKTPYKPATLAQNATAARAGRIRQQLLNFARDWAEAQCFVDDGRKWVPERFIPRAGSRQEHLRAVAVSREIDGRRKGQETWRGVWWGFPLDSLEFAGQGRA